MPETKPANRPVFDPVAVLSAAKPIELPKRTTGGGRTGRDNSAFRNALAAAWEAKNAGEVGGRELPVSGTDLAEVIYCVREAANFLGIGSRVVVLDSKGTILSKDALTKAKGTDRRFRVQFEPQPRKAARKPKAKITYVDNVDNGESPEMVTA